MKLSKRLEGWVAKNGRETDGLLLHRFNDSHSFGGNTHRHSPPFDFVGILGARPIAIECKSTIGKTFSRSMFDDKQIEHLYKWQEAGGISIFVIVINKTIQVITLDGLPKPRQSLKTSNRKIVWAKLNLLDVIGDAYGK